jgi:hypothetical protein
MNQLVIRSLTFADVRAFLIWEQRVVSSNPTAPTNKIKGLRVQRVSPCSIFGLHGYTSGYTKRAMPVQQFLARL